MTIADCERTSTEIVMISWLLACSVLAHCNITLCTDMGSVLYNAVVDAGTTICLNTTNPYLGVVFNYWDECIVYGHQFHRSGNKTHGPYTSVGNVGGLDFGGCSRSSVDIYVKEETQLSFSATNFDPKTHLRILSNHPDDQFVFGREKASDEFSITTNQRMQYFNGAPGKRQYDIEMNVGTDDTLQFCKRGSTTCDIFSGEKKLSRTVPENANPEILTWRCNTSNHNPESDYIKILIKSDFDTKYYSRLVTNTNQFTEIPVLPLSCLSAQEIVIIVILSVLVILCTIGAVILYFSVRKRNGKRLNNNKARRETDDDTMSETESLGLVSMKE